MMPGMEGSEEELRAQIRHVQTKNRIDSSNESLRREIRSEVDGIVPSLNRSFRIIGEHFAALVEMIKELQEQIDRIEKRLKG